MQAENGREKENPQDQQKLIIWKIFLIGFVSLVFSLFVNNFIG